MYQLCPSILSADFNRLGEQIKTLEKEGIEWLHIDVMDGDVAENWKTMLTEIRLKLIKEGQKFSKKLGQWDYFGEPIGDFNTEYAYRVLVALAVYSHQRSLIHR